MNLTTFRSGAIRTIGRFFPKKNTAQEVERFPLFLETEKVHQLVLLIDTFSRGSIKQLGVERYTLCQLASEWRVKHADEIVRQLRSDLPFVLFVSTPEVKILKAFIGIVLDMIEDGEVPQPTDAQLSEILTLLCRLNIATV